MVTNKVVINTENGPETLIDLTQDSVTPETLADGATAHDASGKTIIGTAFGAILTVEETDGGVKLTATNKDGSSEAVLKNGKDYVLTEADKAEIVRMVIESLGGNPVFGYVDENNNIIVSGNLADGSYSVKYEMENGSTVDIGDLVLDTNVYYSVTNNLTNCANSNSASEVVEGGSYSATISANSGYELKSVSVTMGGSAVSVSGGVINIASITGDIVITAVAEEAVEEVRTNFFDATTGLVGRLSSGGANRTDSAVTYITNYIPVQSGDIVEVSGCNIAPIVSGTDTHYTSCYNSSKTHLASARNKESNNYITFNSVSYSNAQITVTNDSVAYLRFTCGHPDQRYNGDLVVDTSAIVINIKRNDEWL